LTEVPEKVVAKLTARTLRASHEPTYLVLICERPDERERVTSAFVPHTLAHLGTRAFHLSWHERVGDCVLRE
jgi:hypothetical protein